MTLIGWLQAILLFVLVWLCVRPLGAYMFTVFEGGRTWLSPVMGPIERGFYRLCRIDPTREMGWKGYAFSLLAFSLVGLAYLYALLRTQAFLPLNPQHFGNLAPDLAWSTAVSFMTNTNWQFYSGESTMSYLSQMAGLAWHMFVSAGAGIAVAIALIRGVSRVNANALGNFWVDLTRSILYVLLPIAFVGALVLAWQGVPQNFHDYTAVKTLEGAAQSIPQGPMASMESIKELGTNGGGFVNANSASPWENPTGFSDLFELFLILVIGGALTYTYGRYVKNQRQGWAIFAAMGILLVVGSVVCYAAEAAGNPIFHQLGIAGGNYEGKETRFGIAASALWATVTTATSCGAVNAMHDSFTALGGLVPLVNMQLGEVVFGGVGSGLYGMLEFVVLTVFIAGLMVGRTPELIGKKIERREVQLAILAVLVVPAFSLIPASIAAVLPAGLATLNNSGPHGFSELLYAYTSGVNNNGSAFAGLGGNTYWDVSMGISMLFGRLAEIVPVLALGGALAAKKSIPPTAGTFTTTSPIFVVLLIGTILIVGALTFFPADALGPIVEHLLTLKGKLF
ncbi:MAG TPA: potassium-transporting ATPase subunit KdpA [Candidatus Sulfotelmatobacter sp.]|nr:potassium-transporting ATPase subunit KdpA [Candidatus Sulfotelmatobacter sp.]